VVELTLTEGRNRQVRRMVEAVGNRVAALTRTRFGPLELGTLPEGRSRLLRPPEVKRLWKDAGPDER
jgi:23S rRNA pseudouridine2605 synthase